MPDGFLLLEEKVEEKGPSPLAGPDLTSQVKALAEAVHAIQKFLPKLSANATSAYAPAAATPSDGKTSPGEKIAAALSKVNSKLGLTEEDTAVLAAYFTSKASATHTSATHTQRGEFWDEEEEESRFGAGATLADRLEPPVLGATTAAQYGEMVRRMAETPHAVAKANKFASLHLWVRAVNAKIVALERHPSKHQVQIRFWSGLLDLIVERTVAKSWDKAQAYFWDLATAIKEGRHSYELGHFCGWLPSAQALFSSAGKKGKGGGNGGSCTMHPGAGHSNAECRARKASSKDRRSSDDG
jgi:hypothetical protein